MSFEGVCFSQGHVIKGFLGRFWFQMPYMPRMVHRAPARAGSWFRRKSCDELISIASQKANSQISSEVRKWVCGWEMKVCSPFLLFYRRIASQKAKWRWSIFLFFAKRLYSIHIKKWRRTKNISKHIDNHLFCSFCDYILDLCDELCLARTRRESSFL